MDKLYHQYRALIIILIFVSFSTNAQEVSGDLEKYLNTYIEELPGESGNNYTEASLTELDLWETVLQAILVDDIDLARTQALTLNYSVVLYTDTTISTSLYYVLEEKSPKSKHWGTYVFNPNACRNQLVLQAPHSLFDFNTGKQAVFSFIRIGARALFLNGTHRCNHSSLSGCDGTTSVCQGSSSSFQISDLAHHTQNVFQQTTKVIVEQQPNSYFVQLHGFTKLENDPYLILSNGSRDTPTDDKIGHLKEQLLLVDSQLTFKIGHLDQAWDRLLGFTNVQGRLINGSADPCDLSPTVGNGHFIHIEQEKSRLRADSLGWFKLKTALAEAFECPQADLSKLENETASIKVYPNPLSNGKLLVSAEKQITSITIRNSLGQLLLKEDQLFSSFYELNRSVFCHGVYHMSIEINDRIFNTIIYFN